MEEELQVWDLSVLDGDEICISVFSFEDSTHQFTGKVTTGFSPSSPIAYEDKAAVGECKKSYFAHQGDETDFLSRRALRSPFSVLSHCTQNESADPECPSGVTNSSDTTGSTLMGKTTVMTSELSMTMFHEVTLPIRFENRLLLELVLLQKLRTDISGHNHASSSSSLTKLTVTFGHYSLLTFCSELSKAETSLELMWFLTNPPIFNKVKYVNAYNCCSPSKILQYSFRKSPKNRILRKTTAVLGQDFSEAQTRPDCCLKG